MRASFRFSGRSAQGFTLLEITIVLGIIGLVIAGGMATTASYLQARQYNVTVSEMDTIEKALLDYSLSATRLPCPADMTIVTGNSNYGVEAANPGSCTSGSPAANFFVVGGTAEGGVPTRTLRLPDSFMYDGWGRRFRYAVDPAYTLSGTLPINANANAPISVSSGVTGGSCAVSAGAVKISDTGGSNNARSYSAVYALISHGANGHGAYTSNGVVVNAASTNSYELTNCHCTSAGVSATYTGAYVAQLPVTSPATPLSGFDDLVSFKEAAQMQTQGQPLNTACNYMYVTDYFNHRVEKFDYRFNLVASFGSYGTGNGQMNDALSATLDPSGVLWVHDRTNKRIMAFNAQGGYSTQFSLSSMNTPSRITMDANQTIWISDSAASTITQFSKTGTTLSSFGGLGTDVGKFSTPTGIRFDSYGMLWVVDSGNNRIQRCTPTGICTAFGGTGSNGGQFSGPIDVNIDSGDHVWVVDKGNQRIQELNYNGQFIRQLGCPSLACTAGNGATQLHDPDSVSFDINGNVWVVENYNNRMHEFDPQGNNINSYGLQGGGLGQLSGPTHVFFGK